MTDMTARSRKDAEGRCGRPYRLHPSRSCSALAGRCLPSHRRNRAVPRCWTLSGPTSNRFRPPSATVNLGRKICRRTCRATKGVSRRGNGHSTGRSTSAAAADRVASLGACPVLRNGTCSEFIHWANVLIGEPGSLRRAFRKLRSLTRRRRIFRIFARFGQIQQSERSMTLAAGYLQGMRNVEGIKSAFPPREVRQP